MTTNPASLKFKYLSDDDESSLESEADDSYEFSLASKLSSNRKPTTSSSQLQNPFDAAAIEPNWFDRFKDCE